MKKVKKEATVTYVIDEEARTVKAIIKNTKYDAINSIRRASKNIGVNLNDSFLLRSTYIGTAICSENDNFDVKTGMLIARKKAIIKYNKAKVSKMNKFYKLFENMQNDLKQTIEYTTKKYQKFENEISKF